MRADRLLQTAFILLDGPGRVSTEAVRRAASTIYYALFHCLARDCADLLIGGAGGGSGRTAWRRVYRALDHGEARARCNESISAADFPAEVLGIARLFILLQRKRHQADYDPFVRFSRADIRVDANLSARVIDAYLAVPRAQRRAFCAHLLIRSRRD